MSAVGGDSWISFLCFREVNAFDGHLWNEIASFSNSGEFLIWMFLYFRYLVAGGLVDRISRHSRALIETDFFLDQDHESPVLVSAYDLLFRICCHLKKSTDQEIGNVHENNNNVEQTSVESHLLSTLSLTEAAGAIGALYAAVALTPQNQKGSSPTPNQTAVSQSTRILIVRSLRLLKSIAGLNLQKLQVSLWINFYFLINSSSIWKFVRISKLLNNLNYQLLMISIKLSTIENAIEISCNLGVPFVKIERALPWSLQWSNHELNRKLAPQSIKTIRAIPCPAGVPRRVPWGPVSIILAVFAAGVRRETTVYYLFSLTYWQRVSITCSLISTGIFRYLIFRVNQTKFIRSFGCRIFWARKGPACNGDW